MKLIPPQIVINVPNGSIIDPSAAKIHIIVSTFICFYPGGGVRVELHALSQGLFFFRVGYCANSCMLTANVEHLQVVYVFLFPDLKGVLNGKLPALCCSSVDCPVLGPLT